MQLETIAPNVTTLAATSDHCAAIAPDMVYATVYARDGKPVATLSRPRLYGDSAPGVPEASGLFRLVLTNGDLVAAFGGVPTLHNIRRALSNYARAGAGVADATPGEREEIAADARRLASDNMEVCRAASFPSFKASALTRAMRLERRAAIAGGQS